MRFCRSSAISVFGALAIVTAAYAQQPGPGVLPGYRAPSPVLTGGASYSYLVAPSGGDFTTVQAALNAVATWTITTGASVTITVADGTYVSSSPINISQPSAGFIFIQGQHTYNVNLTSIQSSSGSAGAWSIVLNVASVANIAVNDYVTLTNPSGGSNPTYLAGCFKVTNVDALNTRITIASTHQNATAPSGAVTGTLTVLKTILKFTGSDGFQVWTQRSLNLDNLAVVGDGSSHYGLSVQDVSRLYVTTIVGVAGFGADNVLALYNSEINGVAIASSGATGNGFTASDGGVINLNTAVSSGNGGVGFISEIGSSVRLFGGISTGNTSFGFYATNGSSITPASTTASGNGSSGYQTADVQSMIDLGSVTGLNNTGGNTWSFTTGGTAGYQIGTSQRPKVFSLAQSSPIDSLVIASNGASGSWQGAVDLNVSYNGGTLVNGLRVQANTDGTTATVKMSGVTYPTSAASGNFLVATGANTLAAVTPAWTTANPTNQTGNATATFKMNGYGASCAVTPVATGRVHFTISGSLNQNTTADGVTWKLAYGTGGAPANAAAATGTVISATGTWTALTGMLSVPFVIEGDATGLALSTAVWFDLQVADVTGGTASITNATCIAHEG